MSQRDWRSQIHAFISWMRNDRGWRVTWLVFGRTVRPIGIVSAYPASVNDNEASE